MAEPDKRKQSLYFPADVLEEIAREAHRLDRSLSWIVQKAWKVARKDILGAPAAPGVREAGDKTDDGGR